MPRNTKPCRCIDCALYVTDVPVEHRFEEDASAGCVNTLANVGDYSTLVISMDPSTSDELMTTPCEDYLPRWLATWKKARDG